MPHRLSSTWGRYLLLLSASPDLNAVVRGPNVPIRLHFSSRIDLKHSKLILFGPDGAEHDLAVVTQNSPDMLVSAAKGLSHGAYVLQWHVLESGGHVTRGEVQFRVEAGRDFASPCRA